MTVVSNIIIYYIREGWSRFRLRGVEDDERFENLIDVELEEREGLTPHEIESIGSMKRATDDTCLICFEDFKKRETVFEVAPCGH